MPVEFGLALENFTPETKVPDMDAVCAYSITARSSNRPPRANRDQGHGISSLPLGPGTIQAWHYRHYPGFGRARIWHYLPKNDPGC